MNNSDMINFAHKISHIWDVFYEAYEEDHLGFSQSSYLGFKPVITSTTLPPPSQAEIDDRSEIIIQYKKVYNNILNDDDDYDEAENTHIESIRLPFRAIEMSDDELKRLFIQKTKRKETLYKIEEHNKEIERLTKGIKKYNLQIAELKAPDYVNDKIKEIEGIVLSWTNLLTKEKVRKMELKDILDSDE